MNLYDKNVIYVGGFGGIGLASCKELLKNNIKSLVIMELQGDAQKINQLLEEFPSQSIHFVQIDVTNKENIETAYVNARELLKQQIDIVINGSGVYNDQNPELTVQVNLLGVINSTLVAFQHMNRGNYGNGGLIVNISSVTGLVPNPFMAIYSATKAGIINFTRALANDLYYNHSGICLLAFCPAGTKTDLIKDPLNKSTFKFINDRHRQKNSTSIKQTSEECAKCLIEMITIAEENGSVWVCDLGKLEKIKIPTLWGRK